MNSRHRDETEHRYEALSICYRLYNFFFKSLSAHAFKTVILGHPNNKGVAKAGSGSVCARKNGQAVHRAGQVELREQVVDQCDHAEDSHRMVQSGSSGKDLEQKGEECPRSTAACTDISEGTNDGFDTASDRKRQEDEVIVPSAVPEAKAPKKVVSISERVEAIDTKKRKTRRKISKEKSSSFEEQEILEPKPILKTGSDLGRSSSSYVDHRISV